MWMRLILHETSHSELPYVRLQKQVIGIKEGVFLPET